MKFFVSLPLYKGCYSFTFRAKRGDLFIELMLAKVNVSHETNGSEV